MNKSCLRRQVSIEEETTRVGIGPGLRRGDLTIRLKTITGHINN